MQVGQRVTISAPGRGRCAGRIQALLTPAELPRILEADPPAELLGYADSAAAMREILTEMAVTRVVWVTYKPTPRSELIMCAFETRGEWRDLRGQVLTIEPVQ